jgi:hypothetical protein
MATPATGYADGHRLERAAIVTGRPSSIRRKSTSRSTAFPAASTLTLDGLPMTTPTVYDTLVGFNHEVEAPDQAVLQTLFTFTSWSDGGAKKHIITVPAADSSLVATYTASQNPFPNGLVAGYRFQRRVRNHSGGTSPGTGTTARSCLHPAWTVGQYGWRACVRWRRLRESWQPLLLATHRKHDPHRLDQDKRESIR